MGVKDYDLNPDNNTQINGINIAEGCPPSGINNAIRQLMADVKADSDAQNTKAETPASAENLGPVKVGDGLTMGEDGTLSADLATAEAAGRVKASVTAQAGTVPLGGADGSLDEKWLKPAMDVAQSAQDAADSAMTAASSAGVVTLKATRTTTGMWTVTGLIPGRPVYLLMIANVGESATYSYKTGFYNTSAYPEHFLGYGTVSGTYVGRHIAVAIPKSANVTINITTFDGIRLELWQ